MADLSRLGRSLELAGKAARSLADEGPATTVQKVRWRLREELSDRRADTHAPAARQLAAAPLARPLPAWPNHVTVVTAADRSPRAERRLDHLLATAGSAGLTVTPTSLERQSDARRMVTLSNAVILFQVPHSRAVAGLVARAAQTNIPVFYMAVEPWMALALGQTEGPSRPRTAASTSAVRSARTHVKALGLAEHAIGATTDLAERMSASVPGGVFTLPYSTDESLLACLRGIARGRGALDEQDPSPPVIGYESLSLGHDLGLASISRSLVQVLLANPAAELRIAGQCALPASLTNFGPRVRLVEAANVGERMRALSESDVVVVPVAPTAEASLAEPLTHVHATELGIPVLVSDVPEVQGRVDPRGLCRTSADWEQWLQSLLDSPELRTSFVVGSRERSAAWGIPRAARHLTAILAEEASATCT